MGFNSAFKGLMYELRKFGKVFRSKFVGTGPSSYKKKNLPGRGLTEVEKHCYRGHTACYELKKNYVLYTAGCNIIIQYKQTKCTFF